ncbi:hypothetical protein GCM10009574_082920 [Streptomyces asiaticus]|uniref:Uncharacterized protein n=2 Tax=Streptomyces rhizosphaericus TaxID=114699 RepID=A0ABP4D2P8_9ACTN
MGCVGLHVDRPVEEPGDDLAGTYRLVGYDIGDAARSGDGVRNRLLEESLLSLFFMVWPAEGWPYWTSSPEARSAQ